MRILMNMEHLAGPHKTNQGVVISHNSFFHIFINKPFYEFSVICDGASRSTVPGVSLPCKVRHFVE